MGGTIYEIRGYDPLFRLAVEWEGQYYIAQCVDMLDDSEILLSDYFETAGFYDTTEQIRIYDHAGRSVLAELSGGDMEQMLELLAQSEPAGLTISGDCTSPAQRRVFFAILPAEGWNQL